MAEIKALRTGSYVLEHTIYFYHKFQLPTLFNKNRIFKNIYLKGEQIVRSLPNSVHQITIYRANEAPKTSGCYSEDSGQQTKKGWQRWN